jgi:hypothetical protein
MLVLCLIITYSSFSYILNNTAIPYKVNSNVVFENVSKGSEGKIFNEINNIEINPIPHASYILPKPTKLWNKALPLSDDDKIRRDAIKEAFLHSWQAYKRYAWGSDELNPLSKTRNDWMGQF